MTTLMPAILLLALGGDLYVAPEGKPENAGTKESPWDLQSTLRGNRKVAAGDTVWVRGGAYRGKFEIRLRGKAGAPIVVRGMPGERASILDCGLQLLEPCDYVWIRDLEIAGTTPVEKRISAQTGSWPSDLPGSGGLDVYAGRGCRFINLVIHDNVRGGVGWWVGSTDSEMHGCLIYDNGWKAPDRSHGHAVYAQNRDGLKKLSACILSVPAWGGSHTMHAYGSSKAWVDNFTIEDVIAYDRGSFLVGGDRPSRGLRLSRNFLHGVGMQVGYGSPENEDVELRDNVAPAGLALRPFKKVVDEGNVRSLPPSRAVLIRNAYDPGRAHAAVYNGAKAEAVELDVAGFLQDGEGVRLLDPKDVYGKPLHEAKAAGGKIRVPMAGEFAAFVLLK